LRTWNWKDGKVVPYNAGSVYRNCRRGTESSLQLQLLPSRQQIKSKIRHLLDLDFIMQGTNIILIGNPGTGKTLLSKVIGWKACKANLREGPRGQSQLTNPTRRV
jgi:IstB-like ATP binding protein